MKQNLTIKKMKLSEDNILVKKFIKGIEGGRTLDTTDWTAETIPAGWVIAAKTAEGAKTYFPLPWEETEAVLYTYEEYVALDGNSGVTAEEFAALSDAVKTKTAATAGYRELASGETYEGMLYNTVLKSKPAAAIMTWAIVNAAVLPHPVPADFKTALPHIDYQIDEEA